MNLFRQLRFRLRALFRGAQLDREVDAEMRFHLEMQARDYAAGGATPVEARRAAAIAFGGVERAKEDVRDARGLRWLDDLGRDVRFGARMVWKSRGFTAVAVLTLAFGIAVNTTIFSMISTFFFEPRNVPDAGRLVIMMQRSNVVSFPQGLSFPDFRDYRAQVKSLEDLLAYMAAPVHLGAAGLPAERAWVDIVTPGAFAALRVPAALGRTLLPEDGETPDAPPVIVLSHLYWKNHFGGDPAIVGRTITLNGRPFTVVGVAREGFQSFSWAMSVSGFVPISAAGDVMQLGDAALESRSALIWRVMARVREGATFEQARAEVVTCFRNLAAAHPADHQNVQPLLWPEMRTRPDPAIAEMGPAIAGLFMGMVGLVLFIACANVANLMLARALVRQREMVLRAALGASRWRLVRQLLVESVLLALIAGALGLGLGRIGGWALDHLAPLTDVPANKDHAMTWHVYVFTFGAALVTGVATGLLPALRASRFQLFEKLKETGAGRFAAGRHRLRNALVVGQVALSIVVLVCSGLFLQSLAQMKHLPLGVRTDHLLLASMDLGRQGYDAKRGERFLRDLLERIRALPDVANASVTSQVPFDMSMQFFNALPEEPIAQLPADGLPVAYCRVGPDAMQTLDVPLLRGRPLSASDRADTPRVAVINQTMADVFWPGQDALGKRFSSGNEPWIEVVGIAATGRYVMLAEPPRPYFYVPIEQDYLAQVTLVVRTRGAAPGSLAPAVRDAVATLDSDLPLFNVRSMEDHLRASVFGFMPMRIGFAMTGAQGVIGLLLAVMGLYAVVAYTVNQRTQEIGVRLALGATRAKIVHLVAREGARLTIIGTAAGLVVALGLSALLSRVLYGVPPFSPPVFFGVSAVLATTTALACALPARRATRVDPMVALRVE